MLVLRVLGLAKFETLLSNLLRLSDALLEVLGFGPNHS